jgi:hypothetical protein
MKTRRTPKQRVAKKATSRLDYKRDILNRLKSIETLISTEQRLERSIRKDVTSPVALVKQLNTDMFHSLKDINPNVAGV